MPPSWSARYEPNTRSCAVRSRISLRVEVQDSGQWKPGGSSADRGLGLTLMRSLMETVELNTADAGTTIVMERRVDLRRGLAFAADG